MSGSNYLKVIVISKTGDEKKNVRDQGLIGLGWAGERGRIGKR